MNTELTVELSVETERVDDIPLLLAEIERMGLPALLDEHFVPHGNWQGLGVGALVAVWLAYILSRGDHRLSQVQAWVAKRLHTLSQGYTPSSSGRVYAGEWADDRLAAVLRLLREDGAWLAFEEALSQRLVRVYALESERVRIDTTSASGYWSVSEEGLFQFGHSKDHRPDLPQLKVLLATLDPLGLPLATEVLSGERADDPLYVPAIERVRSTLQRRGLLYVGDCKMAALETRAFVAQGADHYLCPLAKVQCSEEQLQRYRATPAAAAPLWISDAAGEPIARAFERREQITVETQGRPLCWEERRLVVQSLAQADAARKRLFARLEAAEAQLLTLGERGRGKRTYEDAAALEAAAQAVLARQRVAGLLLVQVHEEITTRAVRAYGTRPARELQERRFRVRFARNEAAIAEQLEGAGWRVYATNHPGLSLEEAVQAYRSQYQIEQNFGRLKGQPLSLTPMYLQRDDHATGLVRLLSLGLRVLVLLEFGVRRQLAKEGATLQGLYAGNPSRATARPSAELLLEAFRDLTLSKVALGEHRQFHLSPLSVLQQRILGLLGHDAEIYTRLCSAWAPEFAKPP